MSATIPSAVFETTPVFDWNYNSQARININQGGTSSGKTYALLQVIFLKLVEKKRVATIVGQDIPNLKKGALRDFQERILINIPWFRNYIRQYNKTERTYFLKNGSILEFTSYSDPIDASSGKRDILFLNEANGISHAIYEQLAMRTTEFIYLDYNPAAEFWVHEFVMKDPKAVTFYSNFTHNPYVDDNIKEYIYSLKERDAEAWRVYGLGLTGSIQELVFPRATIIPFDDFPDFMKHDGYGMDFGYIADPTTLIRCGLANRREVYLDEIFFKYNMKTSHMDQEMKEKNVSKRKRIWADKAEPRIIDDLWSHGWDIAGADKGPGSVIYRIQLLNDYDIFISDRSNNIIQERKRYRFKTDRDGKMTNEPVDAWNHTWDAVGYWGTMNLKPLTRRKGRGHGVRKVN